MHPPIVDQVVDFYYPLFTQIFSETFRPRIADRLKRDAVIREVQDSAGAASQSLTRFFLNERLTEQQVADVLTGFSALGDLLKLDEIANPNVTPETVVATLLTDLPCPEGMREAGHDAVYRVALHSVVQVLTLVGPVMAEWQKLNFSSTFELPRRVVHRLNQISEQIDARGRSGQAAADERYELSYRDYLLQRFHRVEAGTVRMTTNLDVDLRELFVMPRVLAPALLEKGEQAAPTDATALIDLATARRLFESRGERGGRADSKRKMPSGIPALDQVKGYPRNVIVGVPGSGKSTFLEWFQLKLAAVEEELVMAGQQAIPLLLRVRQLDPRNLPRGAALIEKATASKDRAALMPAGWIERQMIDGRVLFMLDGLDETEPDLRDGHVLPWLHEMCREYPNCRYLVASRPVGYALGTLRDLEFVESYLLDFGDPEISEYTRHWCTAVRLGRNEPAEEARREGGADGERIVQGFTDHPYIRNLARNPLMLSAICLVSYFESGKLPKDRALLYELCVEGLLHHWDQRRGIFSEFGLEEKLRTCREVALAMQAGDRAECEADKVQRIFEAALGDPVRAEKLLMHIRRRTGLLLERRPGVFAFAHLTFQEYLAARAVHEGNRLRLDLERLVREHDDGRWQEVMALFCGLATAAAAREMVERLVAHADTRSLSTVLSDAYLSASPELSQDDELRRRVLQRIAVAPGDWPVALDRFPIDKVTPIANLSVGTIASEITLSVAHRWLHRHPELLDAARLSERVRHWREMKPFQIAEVVHLLHAHGPSTTLVQIATDAGIYAAPGPNFPGSNRYGSQGEVALIGLAGRRIQAKDLRVIDTAFLQILRTLSDPANTLSDTREFIESIGRFLQRRGKKRPPQDAAACPELASLGRKLAKRLEEQTMREDMPQQGAVAALNSWAGWLEHVVAASKRRPGRRMSKSKGKTPSQRTATKGKRGGNGA